MASFLNRGDRESFGPTDPVASKSGKPAPASGKGNLQSFLGQGCEFQGKLNFSDRVRIEGTFKGEIFSNGYLQIGPDGQVEAEIDVDVLEVSGRVQGTINARSKVVLRNPARVSGSITTPKLMVEDGVVFDGSVNMGAAGRKNAPGAKSAGTAKGGGAAKGGAGNSGGARNSGNAGSAKKDVPPV